MVTNNYFYNYVRQNIIKLYFKTSYIVYTNACKRIRNSLNIDTNKINLFILKNISYSKPIKQSGIIACGRNVKYFNIMLKSKY